MKKLALLAFLPMFFLGAAPSYASCVRVPGVAVGCNYHPTYHRVRYNEYHHPVLSAPLLARILPLRLAPPIEAARLPVESAIIPRVAPAARRCGWVGR